jgi:extracellular elastinolytic metalloproteinase
MAASSLVFASAGGAAPGAAQANGRPFLGDEPRVKDVDARKGNKNPTGAQEAAAHGRGLTTRWNKLGTPEVVTKPGGVVASGFSGDAVSVAKQWIERDQELLGLSPAAVDGLEVVASNPIGSGAAVLLRQRFEGLAAGLDGLLSVGVSGDSVVYASSALSRDTALSGTLAVPAQTALRTAAADVGVELGDVFAIGEQNGWAVFTASALTDVQRTKLVAVPTPADGVRRAWEVIVSDLPNEVSVQTYVDAETGGLLDRETLIDYATDNPQWKVFRSYPNPDYSSTDTRELWCWSAAAGCALTLASASSPLAWDVDPATGLSTNTTRGNNDRATENWVRPPTQGTNYATPSPTRDYVYPWTNQWYTASCNPSTFTSSARVDIDAATANLFAMHNRMHDWSYTLGFTESAWNAQVDNFGKGGLGNDPEHGNSQAGAIAPGSRDNANQNSPPDGMSPTSNMFLWQPTAGGFYAPCVDGDYDMSVIGHEYTHMISNRMVAGPNSGIGGGQGGSMGESWSDLAAAEYLFEYGWVPVAGENPYAIGPYVTGEPHAGIRNYALNESPLNYSDIGYDVPGVEPHSDGEIWNAANWDVRQALIARYGAGDAALQRSCADGATPVAACPGNRRWIQLVFDAWLLMATSQNSMLTARDALLAADAIRFGGANQGVIWNAFASRGFGKNAASNGPNDGNPTPSFESDYANNATVTFKAVGDADGFPVQLYVGDYEARSTPIADTDPATALPATFAIVPGAYSFVARGAGFGQARFTAGFVPGQVLDLPINMPRNLVSAASGATATGDGTALGSLIDDTEGTQWTATGAPAGKQVTIRLDPTRPAPQIRRVQVSGLVGPGQSRFSAIRQFEVLACEAKAAVDCSTDAQFTLVYTSPANALPAVAPRPRAPELLLRSFDIPQVKATHLRFRVVTSQCTGTPAFAGEQDADPTSNTDCATAAPATASQTVRVAEFEAFSR